MRVERRVARLRHSPVSCSSHGRRVDLMSARALNDRMEDDMTGRLRPRPYFSVSLVVLAVLALPACGSSKQGSGSSTGSTGSERGASASALAPIHGKYAPKIDPANFVATIDNRYFPLVPGTGFHYRGVAENGKTPQTDDMVVTHRTKDNPRHQVRGCARHRLFSGHADRTYAGLVRPGHGGQRLVHGRGHA